MKNKLAYILCMVALLTVSCRHYEVGDYYRSGDICGVILALDDEDNPQLIVALDEARDLDADSAVAWCATFADGKWRLPDKEEMTLMSKYRSLLNATLQHKGAMPLLGSNTYYWTSTPCSESHTFACGPLGIKCYFKANHSPYYRARAIRTIDN